MSVNPGPPGKGAKRLSPDELAQEVARLLKKDGPRHVERSRRFDVVSLRRILMAVTVVLLGVGVAVAVPWIGGLVGYETPGMVSQGGPIFGCPGELALGEVFKGETVQVVGRSDNDLFYALRDERGPDDIVYAEVPAVTNVDDAERLPTRSCEPRDDAVVLAAATTLGVDDSIPTTTTTTPTTMAGDVGTTTIPVVGPGVTVGRPPRRGTSTPGAPTTTTPPSTAPTSPGPTSTEPPVSPTTTRPPAPPSTNPSTTTTTRPPTTSSSTTSTTSTTTSTTTTTTQPTTTTTDAASTTSEATTTTTEAEPTTTAP